MTRLHEWRAHRLMFAGVEPALARELAQSPGLDVHALLELLDRGCPVSLALRIVDPYHPTEPAP